MSKDVLGVLGMCGDAQECRAMCWNASEYLGADRDGHGCLSLSRDVWGWLCRNAKECLGM